MAFRPVKSIENLLARVAALGVEPGMAGGEAKHVRFGNIAALTAAVSSLLFIYFEAQLLVDWGDWNRRDWTLLAIRIAVVAPFLAPLFLNAVGRRRLARLWFVGWSAVFCLVLALYYGRAAPTPLFFMVLAMLTTALFPRADSTSMIASLIFVGVTLVVALWLRRTGFALDPENRALILNRIDSYVTLGSFFIVWMIGMAQRVAVNDAEKGLALEQARSERLILNILPAPIAARLKTETAAIADRFDDVTVLFADIVGFTPLARKMAPDALVALLDDVFRKFDALADQYGLEKIKTIGDAYMVAGGLPAPARDHTASVARMALAMVPVVQQIKTPEGAPLAVRIGLAKGPAIAGVIGERKFSYDLWGDTVNMASRLESHGVADRIQVNEAAHAALQDMFLLAPRGEVDLKGQGRVKTWFLTGEK